MDIGLGGVIGFYGVPTGPYRNGSPAPADVTDRMLAPVLGLFGGADEGIPQHMVETFETSLGAADSTTSISYPGAPA